MGKILLISEVFYPEYGLVNDFAYTLKDKGYDVEVLTREPSYPYGKVFAGYANDDYRVDIENGIKVHRIKTKEGYRDSFVKKLLNYISFVRDGKKTGCRIGDIYEHIIVCQTGPLTVALPGVAIKRKFGTPLTVWTFDIWPDVVYAYRCPRIFPMTTILNRIVSTVYKNADNILVSSKRFTDTIKRYVPDKQIHYAPNWILPEREETSDILFDTNRLNITFTGNISNAQNLDNVLRGWHMAALQEAVLNIVGDGSALDRLKATVNKQGIRNVVFHGRYPSSQIADILSKSDILLLPLKNSKGIEKTEPFKLQSYLKAGKPIFGVIAGAGKEIIEENDLGVCADPGSPDAIADGFRNMISFLNDHKDVCERAKSLLRARFDRDNTINRIISIINNSLYEPDRTVE